MFTVGQRVNREYMLMGIMNDRLGNVTYVDKSARVAHVVFDNHTEKTPALCTFESLKPVTVLEKETPAHEDYNAIERFRELKSVAKSLVAMGDSVAFLHEHDGKLTVSYGRKYDGKCSGTDSYQHGIVTREGARYFVHHSHVASIEN